jgi:hypothetical protein
VLKRLNPFTFLTGFDRGPLAEPFITFWPGSTTRPLPSAAILLQHASFRRGDSSFEGRLGSVLGEEGRWWNSGELAEELLCSNVNTDQVRSQWIPTLRCQTENTVEDANSRDGVAEVVQYYQEVPALTLVRSQADKQVLHHQES